MGSGIFKPKVKQPNPTTENNNNSNTKQNQNNNSTNNSNTNPTTASADNPINQQATNTVDKPVIDPSNISSPNPNPIPVPTTATTSTVPATSASLEQEQPTTSSSTDTSNNQSPDTMMNEVDHQDSNTKDDFKALPVELPAGLLNKPRGRRGSVSAESDRTERVYKKITIPKTEDQINRIKTATKKSFLFTGLDKQQQQDIIDSMEELKVNAGDTIIRQSETGDYFYIIDHGKFDVFKLDNGEQKKVFEYNETGSFGELALMYNCPRAATVKATTEGTLWRVDRETFRHIIIDSTAKKRKIFEDFLESIPILANLSKQERAHVADCLETITFKQHDYIIKQGDTDCDQVYFIVKGRAMATQTPPGSKESIKVGEMKQGEYFGERSLITREPRAANVIALEELECAAMDRSAFERLLGDVKEIMQRQINAYKTAEQIQQEEAQQKTS